LGYIEKLGSLKKLNEKSKLNKGGLMIKERAWPVRVMYMLIAAALAISLIIVTAPAHRVSAEAIPDAKWDRVSTPVEDDFVLAPDSRITDYAIGDDGEVAYAVVYDDTACGDSLDDWYLLMSDDHAATWKDITEALDDVLDKRVAGNTSDDEELDTVLRVATDGEDSEFVAVAIVVYDEVTGIYSVHVLVSTDGGATFWDTDDDGVDAALSGTNSTFIRMQVSDLAVSPEVVDKRDIAIVGSNGTVAWIFGCTAYETHSTSWEDATLYDGWDDEGEPTAFTSMYITDVKFAPSWAEDNTIVVVTIVQVSANNYTVYLQSGIWGKLSQTWNKDADFEAAVPVIPGVDLPSSIISTDPRGIAGVTMPLDYEGEDPYKRYSWVWVNYLVATAPYGTIFLVNNDAVGPLSEYGQIDHLWLTNVDYLGYISEGKAIAGLLGDGEGGNTTCCTFVQVFRNDRIANMNMCCEDWVPACKPPTGRYFMEAFYVSNDPATSKAYAVALWGFEDYDEGAWSVSVDDGDVWNQLSLIDTFIDRFSDVAVSPDCNKTMLVSINPWRGQCECDSVWLHASENLPEAPEYTGKWVRTWCGQLELSGGEDKGLLRLAPEETDGMTVYLVNYGTNEIYWNEMETWGCWEDGAAKVLDEIVDLAVKDKETIYALDKDGRVAMCDDYGATNHWAEAVDSKVEAGCTIAVWGDDIIVGGCGGDVSHSADGGETFTALKDVSSDGYVTVAFDSYFDINNTIYAALAWASGDDEGVYRWIIDVSEEWKDLMAEPLESQLGLDIPEEEEYETVEVQFTGLVLDRPNPGNPMTSADTGGVLYASYYGYYEVAPGCYSYVTGVARYLTPAEDVICKPCGDWDYLVKGLTIYDYECCPNGCEYYEEFEEWFGMWPDALKICGCLDATTSSKLFAIDDEDYDMCLDDLENGQDGAVWMFVDCYAKKAPDLTYPGDGDVIAADPCSCFSVPFTLKWDRLCDACSYDIQFALDDEFTMLVKVNGEDDLTLHINVEGDTPSFSILGGEAGQLSCETTYYWRVRAADAATSQYIRSWWSEEREITIAPSVEAGEINLVSPAPGATGVAIKNVGFSWELAAAADAFDWVLDDNDDFSSPVEGPVTALTNTAYTCTATLSYGTTYYWQVTAYNEGIPISQSAVGIFTTAATGQFCCPQCGLCFDTQAELQAHIDAMHPAQPATPTWVWVVIAIGAVLVIVVIVLIFRTRRV